MKVFNDFFDMVNKYCKNDDVCLMLVFIFIGIMLCYLFKDRINGYVNFASIDGTHMTHRDAPFLEEIKDELAKDITTNVNSEKTIGIELKPRKPEPTPSTQRQLEVIARKTPIQPGQIIQKTGLLVQDSIIFKPFDEVWNPGFMPLDMVFQNVQKSVKGSMVPTSASPSLSPSQGVAASPTGGEVNLVLVYAPWCGHSKKMLPDYERIKSEFHGITMNGKKLNIMMYDSEVDKDKVKEYGVKGFPSLFIEKDGNRESFPHRTYDKISEYLKSL
jgi:thiol-disulfide isomerase/thioredoxin